MSDTPRFIPARADAEPPAGSVVMLEGLTGTAYQRLFSTDRWHSVTLGLSTSFSWAELGEKVTGRDGAKPILLVHEAPEDGQAESYRQMKLLQLAAQPETVTAPDGKRYEVITKPTTGDVLVYRPQSLKPCAGPFSSRAAALESLGL